MVTGANIQQTWPPQNPSPLTGHGGGWGQAKQKAASGVRAEAGPSAGRGTEQRRKVSEEKVSGKAVTRRGLG